MSNFLKDRKSVRDFKNKKIGHKAFEDIKAYCNELENEEDRNNFEFMFFEEGDSIFEFLKGLGGYAGVMIKSPHYIGLNIRDDKEESIIYGGYYMEKLITKLTNLGLGSCWVSIRDVDLKTKKELFHMEDGNIDYLLAIGYPIAKNPFVVKPFSSRLGIENILFEDKIGNSIKIDELEGRGLDDLFYYIRFAPSSYNNQPWRFILKDHKLILLLAYLPEEELNLIDAGIIMYYFESLVKSIGINNKWKLMDKPDSQDEKYIYRYIGEFDI